MRYGIRSVELVAIVMVAAACGKPELKSIERHQATVEENRVLEKDERGDRRIELVVHRDDCPADRTRLTMYDDRGANADCLRKLAVGSHVERVHAIYKFKPASCKSKDTINSTIGGCSMQGISYQQIGTPCAAPSPPSP